MPKPMFPPGLFSSIVIRATGCRNLYFVLQLLKQRMGLSVHPLLAYTFTLVYTENTTSYVCYPSLPNALSSARKRARRPVPQVPAALYTAAQPDHWHGTTYHYHFFQLSHHSHSHSHSHSNCHCRDLGM